MTERISLNLGVVLDDVSGMYFVDPSGNRVTLDFAPTQYKARAEIKASPISIFQLVSKAPNYLVFINSFTLLPSADQFQSNVLAGNGRLEMLRLCWEQNCEIIEAGGNTTNLWTVPSGITVEYLTETEATDPTTVMQIATLDNSSKELSQADIVTSVANQFDNYMLKGMKEDKAIDLIGQVMNQSRVEVRSYLKCGDILINHPFLLDAIQDGLIEVGVMLFIVDSFNKLEIELPDRDFNIRDLFSEMKTEALAQASSKGQVKITKGIVSTILSSEREANVDDVTALEGKHKAEKKEKIKKEETAAQLEVKRIKSLQPGETLQELTELVFHLSDLQSNFLNFLKPEEFVIFETAVEIIIEITGRPDSYKNSTINKMLQALSVMVMDLDSLRTSVSDRISKTSDLLVALPVKPPKASKVTSTIEESVETEAVDPELVAV